MFKDENRHYSLRKLSVGLASVLIGISFASSMNSSSVKADTVESGSNSVQTVVKGSDAAIKTDAKDDANAIESNTESADEASKDIKQKATKGDVSETAMKNATDGSQIAAKSTLKGNVNADKDNSSNVSENGSLTANSNALKDTVESAKQGSETPSVSHDNSNETTLNVKGSEVKGNQVLVDSAKSKPKMATLMTTTGKKFNTKMLYASKVVSPANDTNGGFDSSWGKLNVNDWKGNVQGDYYQLTDYTGDANHVIVPNEADFTKAGISTSGKQVGVTWDLMHTIFRDKTTAQDATVAFSKTNNKQVKAIGADWSNTWGHNSYRGAKAELSKFDGTNLDVSNVTNMNSILRNNRISDLSSLAGWETDRVTDMSLMFADNQISNLAPLASWKVDHVTDMGGMFMDNRISDISPLANWRVSQVEQMLLIFDSNISSIQTKTIPAKRVINFVYPTDYTGKKQDSIIQTVDVPQKVNVELTTNAPKPSDNILDWVTKTETPEASDPVYFQDYTVPKIEGLLEPDQTVISRQQADITKPINVTVTYDWAMSTTSKIVESNANDAFALDPKNGLHEHANVNNNGGYDEDYWGKLNINDWNYTTNDNTITITGYKGNNQSSLIIPNGADFDLANGQGAEQSNVEISSSVMHDLAKNVTRIGLSKTANKKVIAKDAIWQDAFGGMTNKPGTTDNAHGGIKYGSPNLTQMDLHNLDTSNITNMSAMFNGGTNLKTIGDLSEWNTSNVTNMTVMFQSASNLTNLGNLDNWDTSNVTNMSNMFFKASSLTNIGDLSNWDTSNVTNMNGMFFKTSNLTNIGDLDNWNTSKVTDMSDMFDQASSLTNIGDLSNWDTSNVTNMNGMFFKTSNLTNIGDLDNWNTSKVTDMGDMFGQASSLTNIGDLSNWNTSKVTDMNSMFFMASSLTNIGDLSKWDAGKVTDMSDMFYRASSLTNIGDLSNWDTGNVTDMNFMFGYASSLTNIGDLSNWNTSKVTDMNNMFRDTSSLTSLDVSNWDTSNVTRMDYMFCNASSLTNIGDLSNWNTSKVTDMSDMFSQASSLTNLDISKWNTSNVTNMSSMFSQASSLTGLDLSNWDTSKVTDMSSMFSHASSLTGLDLSNWDTSKVTDMNSMFSHASSLTSLDLSNWDTSKVTNMSFMFTSFEQNSTSRLVLIIHNPDGWQHATDFLTFSNYLTNEHVPAVITTNLNILKADDDSSYTIDGQTNPRSAIFDATKSPIAGKVLPTYATGMTDDQLETYASAVIKLYNEKVMQDYQKAHPDKLISYAPTQDMTDPRKLATANFITKPNVINVTIHFEDVDPNADKDSDTVKQELAKTVELSGHSGDTANLSQVQLPTNFELSGDLPSVTFGDTDSVTIKLKHKLSDEITSKENGVAHARTEVIAPDGTVLIQGGAGVQSFIDQRQDLVTGEMVNGDTHWTYGTSSSINVPSDILNKYIEQYNPAILDTFMNQSTQGWQDTLSGLRQPLQIKLKDGYTVKSTGNWEDWNNNGTYTWVGLRGDPDWNIMKRFDGYDAFQIAPLDQSVHYQFMDNGTQVGSDVIINGKTGETVAPNLSLPENYEVADGTTLPTSYTFAATNPNIQINLKHKTETSVESLPATRTINVHLPNGTTKVYEQIIGYQRDVITDLVTKTVTRGTWTVNDVTSSFTIDGVKQLEHSYVLRNGNYNFVGIKLPKVPGYKAKVSKNNGLLLVSYLALAPEKPEINTNLNDQFSNNLAVNSTIKSDLIVKSDMYQVVNDNHNWQLPVIKNYELKFATNKNQIIFAYTKDKQNDYRFVLTFKDGQYRLATFDKENKLLKTYSIKSYDELAKIIHSLVLMNIA